MKKIGIDCDGCLVDFTRPFLGYVNDRLGTDFQYEDVTDYDFEKVFGLEPSVVDELVKSFFDTTMFRALRPESGAQEAIAKLREKAELVVVTSRPLGIEQETYDCLEEYFPGAFSDVFFANGRTGNTEGASKPAICRQLGLGYMVEDCPGHAESCAPVVDASFLLRRPWNESESPGGVVKVNTWQDIVDHFYE